MPSTSLLVDLIFVAVTGFVAWHGLGYRDENGDTEWVHLLFGSIAALYCLWVLFHDLLGVF